MHDLETVPEVVRRVLAEKPESFESYDDNTFSLAVHLLPQMLYQMGFTRALRLGFAFIPELLTVLRGGIPKLVLMAEFAADSADEARDMARDARAKLMDISVQTRLAANEAESEKFWKIRREAFALLRKNMKGLYAAPFIDDFVVHPKDYPAFLPKLIGMLKEYGFIFAITGHIGNGNFHIFPMLALDDPKTPAIIRDLSKRVYTLVGEYHGSITGEHNDGIIRTPYLPMMFPPKMLELFAEVKRLFDPHDIFNPGKKVGMTEDDIGRFMRKS
jgi:FAD/FMN-containing dehydrogenase